VSATVALPVKDPFHLARALIYSVKTLESLVQETDRGQPAIQASP
jgi:hypothetical protein